MANPCAMGVLQYSTMDVSSHYLRQERRSAQSEGARLSEAVLDPVVRLLAARRRQTFRALVTVADKSMSIRTTICGANIRVDPEIVLPVPINFGIAGEAFARRAMRLGDIDDAIRGKDGDGSIVPVWSEVRSVLAFPMLSAEGQAFGTVNFDSDKPSNVSGLSDRNVQDALARVAQVVTYLMRSHSPNGDARFPS